MFTVGPVQENCFVARRDGSDRALVVDPGDEADRILRRSTARRGRGRDPAHPHALRSRRRRRPVARATGAPCTAPSSTFVLADINRFVPFAGFGPFEDYDADETVAGASACSSRAWTSRSCTPRALPAGVPTREEEDALFSGDVPSGLGRARGLRWRPGHAARLARHAVDRFGRRPRSHPGTWGHHARPRAPRTPSCAVAGS